jgi:hypothetical protein
MKFRMRMGLLFPPMVLGLFFLTVHFTQASASTDSGAAPPSKDQGQWYEKPAPTVGPAEGLKAGLFGRLLVLQKGSEIYLAGNSTLHQYQLHAEVLKGSAVLKGRDPARDLPKGKAGSMSLIVPVEFFKSKERGLDKDAHLVLKEKENPEIKFVLTGETMKTGAESGTYVMTAHGKLSAAGVTIPVTLTAQTTFKDGQVRLRGVQKLKFSDFKIKPPSSSVLFVTITCKDEFEIHYDVTFGPRSSGG